MALGSIAEGITREIERAGDGVSGLFEPVVRLGVTGLSRAGKTVFITSLVANLLDRGRMPGLAAANGRIRAVWLQPHPDHTVPRFDYEQHLAALTGQTPHWPEGTAAVSQLRLSFRLQPQGILGRIPGPKVLHLDIVDYPGEWLTDLTLMKQSYSEWSAQTLETLRARGGSDAFSERAQTLHDTPDFEEPMARELAELYTEILRAHRASGYALCTPGRFLMPGDLAGAPALSFAPLPRPDRPVRRGLWREMERRFEAYKARIVKPFFQNHFSRIDRQIVLTDTLGAIHRGPAAVADLREAMTGILKAFKPGANGMLSWLWRSRRVDRILFAATKADLLHHTQHPRLTAIMEALLRDARDRAGFAGAETKALSIAALRTTVETVYQHENQDLDCVRGLSAVENSAGIVGEETLFYAGGLPEDPSELLTEAQLSTTSNATSWLAKDFDAMRFLPAPGTLRPGAGPPHIRLDATTQFLIGDKF